MPARSYTVAVLAVILAVSLTSSATASLTYANPFHPEQCELAIAAANGALAEHPQDARARELQAEGLLCRGLTTDDPWALAAAMAGFAAQTGSAVGGMLKLTGSNVFTGGAVTGQVEAQHVTLALVDNGATQATFSGDLVDGTVSGQWQCPAIKDTGVWFGTLQAVPSQAVTTE